MSLGFKRLRNTVLDQLFCLAYRLLYALTMTESSGMDYSDTETDN